MNEIFLIMTSLAKLGAPLLLALLLLPASVLAQPAPTGTEDTTRQRSLEDTVRIGVSPRPWYDTLTVTKPRYAYASPLERLALAAFTAISIPVGLSIGVTTLLPPSITVMQEDGVLRSGVAFSTGIGFGGDTSKTIFFPDFRLQLEGAYFFTRVPQPVMRAGLLVDYPAASIHSRDFAWFGLAGGGGISTDFSTISPYAEGWVGLMNPMGIRFLTLFPMHHYGLRGRVGYNTTTGSMWYELSLTATSTFW